MVHWNQRKFISVSFSFFQVLSVEAVVLILLFIFKQPSGSGQEYLRIKSSIGIRENWFPFSFLNFVLCTERGDRCVDFTIFLQAAQWQRAERSHSLLLGSLLSSSIFSFFWFLVTVNFMYTGSVRTVYQPELLGVLFASFLLRFWRSHTYRWRTYARTDIALRSATACEMRRSGSFRARQRRTDNKCWSSAADAEVLRARPIIVEASSSTLTTVPTLGSRTHSQRSLAILFLTAASERRRERRQRRFCTGLTTPLFIFYPVDDRRAERLCRRPMPSAEE